MLPIAGRAEVRAYLRGLFVAYPGRLAGVLTLHLVAAAAGLAAPRCSARWSSALPPAPRRGRSTGSPWPSPVS
ncbi:hypothetical protein [Dactylosporangium darangshiense]|uniref:hypothetical protein n=1 Tax=Dactylosporangium darangshiense TaxID=579108 RepID=UPI00362D125B